MSPRLRSGQRGAIGLMAAGTLAVALVFMLLTVDSGRLYLEKRKLQSIADTSALEAANRGGQCTAGNTAVTYATQNATRNNFIVVAGDSSRGLAVTCGTLATNASNIRVFSPDSTKSDAIRVIATHTVASSIANGVWNLFSGVPISAQTTLTATAVAALAPPAAQLTIRSTLGTIDSAKASLLNAVIGGLLGGSLNVSVAGWQGIAATNINLLSYLNQLAIQVDVKAGDYATLLNTVVSPTQLLSAAVTVLQQNGAVGTVTLQALNSIQLIAANSQVTLGKLLGLSTGTSSAALNTNLQLFSLIQGVAQLANTKSAASLAYQINIPLVGSASITTKVIEPPQISAVGNPLLAKAGQATGTNQIFVRTAQVRTLVSIDAPVLQAVSQLASAVTGLAVPLAGVVNNLLHLNLAGVVSSALCLVSCNSTDVVIATKLDISLEAGSAQSYVSDFSCVSDTTKTLTVKTSTSLATLAIGYIDPVAAFSSSAPVVAQPIRLIDIGSRYCFLSVLCNPNRTPNVGGGLLLKAQSSVAAQNGTLFFSPVAAIGATPTYLQFPTNGSINIINSLGATLSGLQVTYAPPSGSVSNSALAGVAGLLTTVTNTLITAIQGLLAPVLDPIVNTILSSLGISLGNADVGANLSCHAGRAYLVI